MLEAFSRPRIEGRFSGDGMRAWNVVWGKEPRRRGDREQLRGRQERRHQRRGVRDRGGGLFSLQVSAQGRRRADQRRVRLNRRPMADLKRVRARRLRHGRARLRRVSRLRRLRDAARLRSPPGRGGRGLRRDLRVDVVLASASRAPACGSTRQIAKATGEATGAAFVGWDGTYSFNIDGRRIPVESLKLAFPKAPLSGLLHFNATGAGNFDEPRYDVKARVDDLFAGDEGVGQLTGRLSLRGDAADRRLRSRVPRLSVSRAGRLELTDRLNAEMSMRFQDTSLDPYCASSSRGCRRSRPPSPAARSRSRALGYRSPRRSARGSSSST